METNGKTYLLQRVIRNSDGELTEKWWEEVDEYTHKYWHKAIDGDAQRYNGNRVILHEDKRLTVETAQSIEPQDLAQIVRFAGISSFGGADARGFIRPVEWVRFHIVNSAILRDIKNGQNYSAKARRKAA